ncbi:MAG: HAMP domain-containing histidine kinase [Lachnospiraceae bacterium]|nr:HAMP domain-containing histidine kinase [Lachnospiraceae bacterium]MDE7331397.1 HAMP domain-containing histidine kinase [Lachnospiraceae bacterium]
MYKKVHLRLTALCAGITTAIMIIMSLSYLFVSETALYENHYSSFKNDMNTITTNLEQQPIISMEWISKMESQNNYTFFLLDNGIPFLYNQLNDSNESDKNEIFNECMDAYNQLFDIQRTELTPYSSYHVEFEFASSSKKEDFFGSVIEIEKGSSLLQIFVFTSLYELKQQIHEQRILFALINIIAIFFLTAFSWLFTGKLLKPILENQQKQIAFVASASHELRTPLAVILSSVECCAESSPDRQERFLRTIKQEGLRMSSLITDMLTLSESDRQQFSVKKKTVELDTLVINSYESFEPLAKEKSVTLSIELPEDTLPACSCDPDRIRQVISILLHNAISYTPENGRINISLKYKKGDFLIAVTDNGIGISDEDKTKIFDRFYRSEKSRNTKGHFGLGLSIAYEIVNAHKGAITVGDAEGGGTVFTIVLHG